MTILINNIISAIMLTRPGSWAQDTDQAGTFLGVLNVSLRACGTQLGFKPTWGPLMTIKIHLES